MKKYNYLDGDNLSTKGSFLHTIVSLKTAFTSVRSWFGSITELVLKYWVYEYLMRNNQRERKRTLIYLFLFRNSTTESNSCLFSNCGPSGVDHDVGALVERVRHIWVAGDVVYLKNSLADRAENISVTVIIYSEYHRGKQFTLLCAMDV